MSKRRSTLIKTLILIILLFISIYALATNLKTAEELDNSNINVLIKASLEVQYNHSEYSLTEIYTDTFIGTIKDTNFYKTELAPYKIMNDGIVQIDETKDKTLLIFSVHVEDHAGSYFQTITIKKIDNSYRIDRIEYDI